MEILKKYNDSTMLVMENGQNYIYKSITFEEVELYKKLVNIDNENIVKMYNPVLYNDCFYAKRDFVPGLAVTEYIESNGTFSEKEISTLIPQLCDALSAIHQHGIIHRDVSPNNIIITPDGRLKLIDFGISRVKKQNQSTDTVILGTHGFAAPEQFGFHQTSPQSDIYSVGVLINYMLTGELPNEKLSAGMFKDIVLKCTEMDENNRYPNVDELKLDIIQQRGIRRIIRKIPGFRSGNIINKSVASIYYLNIIFLVAVSCVCAISPINAVIVSFAVIVVALAPVILFCDFNRWQETSPLTNGKTKGQKSVITMSLCLLIWLLALIPILVSF